MTLTDAGTARATRGQPRRRLLALALLLVLSLGLGAALAVQAIQTSRRHRATAERVLDDYASFAAFILASRTYRQLGGDVVGAFMEWPAPPRAIAPPSGTACPAGTAAFERAPRGNALRFVGTPLGATELAFLTDTLRNAMPLLQEVGWRFRFIRARGGPVDGYFITSYKLPAGGFALRGFSVCFASDSSPFRRVMLAERALPPALTGTLPADSLFSIVAAGAQGRPLYRSPTDYAASPYRGTARLGPEFGDVAVALQLRPGAANRLVIGGMPRSPTPLAVGLMALSTLLVVTALLQLRREYELIAIRSDFISNVSHELRTPLSQILIFTELLKLNRLRSAADRGRGLDVIENETRRLIRLVENVLQFSGSRASRRHLACETLPLAAVVQETLDAFHPLAAARGVTLRPGIPPDASVRADRSALRQILLNLLDNAIKYGPRGQTVRVDAHSAGERTRIVVDDQGPGIPADDRERVWEGYYRLQREAQSAVAGSGIGLAVVRLLATEMGGRAWIEDTESGGARFIVELASTNGAPA